MSGELVTMIALDRRYRMFAELLETGVQDGLVIPLIAPPTFPSALAAAFPPSPDYYTTPISSVNPLQILQHPAFYFYTAASCSVQRKFRYDEALDVEVSMACVPKLTGSKMR